MGGFLISLWSFVLGLELTFFSLGDFHLSSEITLYARILLIGITVCACVSLHFWAPPSVLTLYLSAIFSYYAYPLLSDSEPTTTTPLASIKGESRRSLLCVAFDGRRMGRDAV